MTDYEPSTPGTPDGQAANDLIHFGRPTGNSECDQAYDIVILHQTP